MNSHWLNRLHHSGRAIETLDSRGLPVRGLQSSSAGIDEGQNVDMAHGMIVIPVACKEHMHDHFRPQRLTVLVLGPAVLQLQLVCFKFLSK